MVHPYHVVRLYSRCPLRPYPAIIPLYLSHWGLDRGNMGSAGLLVH